MKYLMVTNFKDYWNSCHKKETYYPKGMLNAGVYSYLKENTETIFIKINKPNTSEKMAWKGHVYDIREDKNEKKIYFKVYIEKEITPCPVEYLDYSEGWYLLDEETDIEAKNSFEPPFMTEIYSNSPQEFEDNVFHMLKLMGIHNIHKYDRTQQAGKADGFFKFENIVVIYDATLNTNFETGKEVQIRNYCQQLKTNNVFEFEQNKYTVSSCDKNIWIITREGTPRTLETIDGITVKEVPFNLLKNLYLKRMISDTMTEQDFANELRQI